MDLRASRMSLFFEFGIYDRVTTSLLLCYTTWQIGGDFTTCIRFSTLGGEFAGEIFM